MTTIETLIVMLLVAGYFYVIGRLHQTLRELRTREFVEKTGKPDEIIVCSNATVIIDERGEISWYCNRKTPYTVKKENEK